MFKTAAQNAWKYLKNAMDSMSPSVVTQDKKESIPGFYSSTNIEHNSTYRSSLENLYKKHFQKTADEFKAPHVPNVAMDSCGQGGVGPANKFAVGLWGVPTIQLDWYAGQTFLGFQVLGMLAQHWLIDKACSMPADDAVRKGYTISNNDGEKIEAKVLNKIQEADVAYRLNYNLVKFVKFGRVFGFRIALFKVESTDPDYYFNPFNIDGVTPGSYKGIVQVDPTWITPELDSIAAIDPASMDFYEPTWWRINGQRYHRSHLIIMRNSEVCDILKPTYFYGGISVPQKIYERVYAAERTANEAPKLALTKRTKVAKVDIDKALANQMEFDRRMQLATYFQDNYATRFIGEDEEMQQFDTSLTDLDAVIMTQYQIVAAAAGVPSEKLLGTTPKGFSSTGEYEESSYHESLESIQTHFLTPLIERHLLILIKSEIQPGNPFSVSVTWNPLDSTTRKGEAENNKLKAETGLALVQSGAIAPSDERKRVINDPNSGYNGMSDEPDDNEELEPDDLDVDPQNDG